MSLGKLKSTEKRSSKKTCLIGAESRNKEIVSLRDRAGKMPQKLKIQMRVTTPQLSFPENLPYLKFHETKVFECFE